MFHNSRQTTGNDSNCKRQMIEKEAKHLPLSLVFLNARSKALAKRTRKSTQVYDLRSTCVSFGHPLAWTCKPCGTLRKPVRKFWFCKLVLTCVDLRVRLARALHVLAWFPHFKRMKFKLLFKGGLYSVANLLIWGFEMLYCILLIDDKVYFTPPPIFNDFIRNTIIRCEGYKQALNILIQRQ